MGLKDWLRLWVWYVAMMAVVFLGGCAGEQLTTVQGDWVKLWTDDQVQPAALQQAPPK